MNSYPLIYKSIAKLAIKIRKKWNEKNALKTASIGNIFYGNRPTKRALISYSTTSFFSPSVTKLRSSDIDLRVIIHEFIRRGYEVDLIDARSEYSPGILYDIIFGMGLPYRRLSEKANPKCRSILYCTEAPPAISLQNETRRTQNYFKRHGITPPTVRSGAFFQDGDFNIADSIIFLGDNLRGQEIAALFQKEDRMFAIIPSTGEDHRHKKPFAIKDKTQFVQVGAGGAIHKGLDIVSEAFAQTNSVSLDVLGHIGLERYFLKKSPNITWHGYRDMGSDDVQLILSRSQFTILHSASEAVPTGVLLAMLHGCIPVLSKNCGTNEIFKDFAFTINSENPEELAEELNYLSTLPESRLANMSDLASKFAARHNVAKFKRDISGIFDTLNI